MAGHYIGLWVLFSVLFLLAMGAYYFAKWHVKGPVIKAKSRRVWKSITFQKEKKAATVKRGKVTVSANFEKEIEAAKAAANSGQDMLQADLKVDELEKAKKAAVEEVAKKEQSKIDKKNNKSKKKGQREETIVDESKASVLDSISSAPTAQDLLHSEDTKEVEESKTSPFEINSTVPITEEVKSSIDVEPITSIVEKKKTSKKNKKSKANLDKKKEK